ncbi:MULTISPECIES: type VI secretion system baseplate subunit TssF [unclassified Paraburkholderia]|uniref:type VI secretion system baseplate subunit TssF n=1 Tax=unclassified Paraburkholderia TaxID=2615204 RepID=UPI002AB5FE92|nr:MULTISPECIES: type VI secretion system baseplate subunit TssF [unclassified Paraburkholderia]
MFNRYYQDELNKLKGLAAEFARANPGIAPMLSGSSADPDVERLLEGVAFLTGLTRQKLDDQFPEFIQELTNLLFPHYLRPVPASTLIGFSAKGRRSGAARVAAGSELASVPVDGTSCRFRTTRDLDVEPLQIAEVNLLSHAGAAPVLMIDFEMDDGLSIAQWNGDSIRLFLNGGYVAASRLLLLLMRHVTDVRISSHGGERISVGAKSLRASGFDTELLAWPSHAMSGYRTIQEFFTQPEKCLFVDIVGLKNWSANAKGTSFSIVMTLDALHGWMPEINAESFLLNVVPAINLFSHAADPITHDHRVAEYRVNPEGRDRRHFQIYSVDQVLGYQQGNARERVYQPFSMFRHDGRGTQLSYRTTQKSSNVERGSDVYLSLNYPPSETPLPETLSIRVTCTNRSLPEGLKAGDINVATSTSPDRMSFANIRAITPAQDPPAGEELLWCLLSHVSLNLASLANADSLRKLLGLYVFAGTQGQELANRRRIEGIVDVAATAETRLVGRGGTRRGQLIRIRCREDHYAGIGDLYLFGCVLERFLGDHAGINSYTRVELEDTLSGTVFKWPPRLGQQAML